MKTLIPLFLAAGLTAQSTQNILVTNTGPNLFRGLVRTEIDFDPPARSGFTPLNCGLCISINPTSYIVGDFDDGKWPIDIECTVPAYSTIIVDLAAFLSCTRPLPWMRDDPTALWGGMPTVNNTPFQWQFMGIEGEGYRIRCTAYVDVTYAVVLDFIYRPTQMSYQYGDAKIINFGPSPITSPANGLNLFWGTGWPYVLAYPNTVFNHGEAVIVPFTMVWQNLMTQPYELSSATAIMNRQISAEQQHQ